MLKPILRLNSFFVKASVIFAIVFILLVVASHIFMIIWLRLSGYSDEGLWLAAKECVVNTVGVHRLNNEVGKVFSECCWDERPESLFYNAPLGSCMDKVLRTLPSSGTWRRANFDGRYALVLRFGCHYNYAWLIIVNPIERLSHEDCAIRHLADNIVVSYGSERINDIGR